MLPPPGLRGTGSNTVQADNLFVPEHRTVSFSTLRDAHLRNIETIMLTDGCAAFNGAVHEATLISLGSVTHQMSCDAALAMLESMP